jgi:2-C-methyl-D-erythritol 4-phosphate cytidylyltransferase
VLAGLERLAELATADDWVLVHDAARPCLSEVDLDRLLDALAEEPVGGLLAVPLTDTLKRADSAGRAEATLDRAGLWCAQTPQMFRFGLLRAALSVALADGVLVTDEAAAMERSGHRPQLVEGTAGNLKVTGPGDLQLAEAVLAAAGEAVACV